MTPISKRKSQLEARLAELTERLVEIEDRLDDPKPKDWEDAAIEGEGDEVLERMGVTGQSEIRMIGAALKRIKDDEYGHCVTCGDPISEERLDVLPFTPFCRKCAP